MNLKLNVFSDSDITKQRDLFKECFPETNNTSISSIDHYFWKFHSKNGNHKSIECCAHIGQNLIGYYGAIPYAFKYLNTDVTAALVCDVMTSSQARGQGVFTKLGKYSTDLINSNGFDFCIGFPIRKEVLPGHLKVGWDKTVKLPLYASFVTFNSFLKNRNLSFLIPIFDFFNASLSLIFKFSTRTMSKSSDITIEKYNSKMINYIDGLSEFYDKWQSEIIFSLSKSMDFLNWRLGAPKLEYTIFVMRSKSNIVGVLISRDMIKENVPCTGILDISIINGYHNKSNLLIEELKNHCKINNRELILIMISNFWYKKYRLLKSLFLKTPFNFIFITKLFNTKIEKKIFYDETSWHLMWIDSDDL